MENRDSIRKKINHLLEICNERTSGYIKAAQNVKDPALSSLFKKYAQQSRDFANELVEYSAVEDPEDAGTRTISDMYRGWMDFKSAISGGDTDAMISACTTGEKQAIDNYEDCLKDELPAELKQKIEQQLLSIKVAYRNLKNKEF